MRVLVACEFSGIVRDAFIEAGHDAISCDLLPTERPGPHIRGDVRPLLREPWDLVIAHPPCTYLANSGVRWITREGRYALMVEAAAFFIECLWANAPRVAVENPTPHGYAGEVIGQYSCAVHPWQFGDGEQKRTCFWLRGLPPLMPTEISAKGKTIHYMTPHADRPKERSRFWPGMARAMAQQWGSL